MHENRLKSILNQNLINNSYSKKLIDDVSNDFSLDTYKFLDEKVFLYLKNTEFFKNFEGMQFFRLAKVLIKKEV